MTSRWRQLLAQLQSLQNWAVVVEFQITWHRNAEPVHAGSRFSFVHEGNFYCVDVAPVTVEDEGHWTCMAENRGGRSSCTSRLTVIGKSTCLRLTLDILNESIKLRAWSWVSCTRFVPAGYSLIIENRCKRYVDGILGFGRRNSELYNN